MAARPTTLKLPAASATDPALTANVISAIEFISGVTTTVKSSVPVPIDMMAPTVPPVTVNAVASKPETSSENVTV